VEKKGVASMRRGAGGSEEERVAGRGRLGCLGLVEDIRAGDCKLKFTDWACGIGGLGCACRVTADLFD
jgi:hypothetical protein